MPDATQLQLMEVLIRRLQRLAPTALVAIVLLMSASLHGQENYFVTYSHEMEEPGNLEISAKSVTGAPKGGSPFVASALELEYGTTGWWTTELYLDGQTTLDESTVFTGFRFENRIRPLLREHWINPVLYFEFEDINAADKTLLEVVGHDTQDDLILRNSRAEKEREIELKLILSSNFNGWNVSENFIAEKNLGPFSWEFGYALGTSRQLASKARPNPCRFCRENFALGAEMYGGLGERYSVGLSDTSHYLGPIARWDIPRGPSVSLSPTFGLNRNSAGFLFRFMVSFEIDQFVSRLRGEP
ncbi:MAG TPA: hypothetical protein VJQ54_13485 [Candidatus Sulfotelmatobacter sp.]|nr:hypothetical protein [Candidatus Sulfotelmatobacter sp.]